MDYNYINQLLDCYWRGETSLEEEEILRTFFSQDNVPAELQQYKPIFVYEASEGKSNVLGEDFDEKMMSLIEQNTPVKARIISMPERLKPLFKAAAMVAIILTLGNALQVPFSEGEDPISSYDGYYKPQLDNGTDVAYSDSSSTAVDTLQQSMVTPDVAATGNMAQPIIK